MDDITELKMQNFAEDLQEIKTQLKTLPTTIINQLNENIDLKIKLANTELEKKFYKWVTALAISVVGELIGLIISIIFTILKLK